jgi:hypothetical protein
MGRQGTLLDEQRVCCPDPPTAVFVPPRLREGQPGLAGFDGLDGGGILRIIERSP